MRFKSGIYNWICESTDELYVGSTCHFDRRRKDHVIDLKKGKHHSIKFQRAWDRYGEAAFKFEILLVCVPTDLFFYEQRAMDVLKPALNMCMIAGSLYQVLHNPESKKKHALRTKEALADPEVNARHRAGLKAAWKKPGVRENWLESLREALSHPEELERKSKASTEIMSDPARRDRISTNLSITLALPEMKKQRSEASTKVMSDPARRARISAALIAHHVERKAAGRTRWRSGEKPKACLPLPGGV